MSELQKSYFLFLVFRFLCYSIRMHFYFGLENIIVNAKIEILAIFINTVSLTVLIAHNLKK